MEYLKVRPKIPPKLQFRVYYKSARTCAVCRNIENPVQIHHIDQNRENNVEENLILICSNCHDKAHTEHYLSQNLTPLKLRQCKNEWEKEIRERSISAMTSSDKFSPLNWNYFNLSLLPNAIISSGVNYKNDKYNYLIARHIINEDLELINSNIIPRQKGYLMNTVFDNIDHNDALILSSFFHDLINLFIATVDPYELDAIWSRKLIKNLLTPGKYIYLMGGMYFKRICEQNNILTKRIHMRAKGICVNGYVYSHYMFGSSTQINTCTGHSYVTGLYYVKNLDSNFPCLNINVTPVALGTGTYEYYGKTPHKLREKNL